MATPQTPVITVPQKNFFRNVPVPGLFQSLVYDTQITLKSTDSAYYSARCFDRSPEPENPLEKELENPFDDAVDARLYALVTLTDNVKKVPATLKAVLDELTFLRRLRLVHKKDDNYYVSSLASFLYRPSDGLFSNPDGERTHELLKPFVPLLVTYTLPGYSLQAYLCEAVSFSGDFHDGEAPIGAHGYTRALERTPWVF